MEEGNLHGTEGAMMAAVRLDELASITESDGWERADTKTSLGTESGTNMPPARPGTYKRASPWFLSFARAETQIQNS